jgi:hypothetical protein
MSEQAAFNFDQQAKLRKAAAAWITANPQAFALFERFALEMANRKRRFGMKALAERVRWQVMATWEKDAEGFKLNNNLVSFLSRELIKRYPELGHYIELRRCADEVPGKPVFEVVREEV